MSMTIGRNALAIFVVLLIVVGVGGYYIDPDPESGFDPEAGYDDGYDDGETAGYASGYDEGYDDGFAAAPQPELDTDEDGVIDAKDVCPNDPGIAGLAGCATPLETITLIAPWASGGEKEAFLPTLSEFTATTAIQVEYVSSRAEELIVTLPLEFAAGTTTGDVVFMTASDVRQWWLDGHVVDVTDLIEGDKFPEFFTDKISIDGTFFGGMYTGSMKPGFWYRPSIFEAKGWADRVPPATLDDFKALLDDIIAEGSFEAPIASGDGVGWPLSDTTEAFIIGLGGPDLHRKLQNDEIRWTDPEVTAVFDELVSWLEAGYFSEPDAFDLQFERLWAGDLAVYFQGSFALTFAAIQDPSDLNFFPFPGTTGAIGSPNYFFVPAYTEHLDEAKQLYQWLVSADAQAISAQLPGIIAFHSGIDPSIITSPTNQRLLEFATTVEYLNDLDDTWGQPYQGVFWSWLQILWVHPEDLPDVLAALNEAQDEHIAAMGG